jgi:HPt (histidine-containing phosphotransfer) domain-containing protein
MATNYVTMTNQLFNLDQMTILSGGNTEFVNKMVDMFIEITPELINRIKIGLMDQNYEEIKAASHKMKPSIDIMGIVSLKSEIRTIEKLASEKEDLMELRESINHLDDTMNEVFYQLKHR